MIISLLLAILLQAPNDPYFPNQHGLELMRVPQAWDITTGDQNTQIVLFGTGVKNHEDLTENIVGDGLVPFNDLDTWMAGVICADTDNGLGMAGTCPHMTLKSYRVIMGVQRLAHGIATILADPNVNSKVLFIDCNISQIYRTKPFVDAIDDWCGQDQRIIIAPAGNSNSNLNGFNNPGILTVGAVNLDDTKASYSNYGHQVDLWAPGHSYVTVSNGNGYAVTDNTAVAASHVAGIAALILSVNPDLTGGQVRDILINTADATPIGPRVNAERALQLALTL